ncbi:MAG: hypothetical protein WC477_01600 [Patescibacteria group bacterium]
MTVNLKAPEEFNEDEWDPQGLNSIDKDELESFGVDEDDDGDEDDGIDEDDDVEVVEVNDEDDAVPPAELDVDGLTELELMEKNLLQEESFDFAMVGEEE